MNESPPDPGIYEDIDFDTYRAWPCVNNSSLGPLRKSPAHYKAALDNPREETDALRFGTFAHEGKLEPLKMMQHYIVMPDFADQIRKEDGTPYANPRNTKAYREKVEEFERVNAGKEIVPKPWYDQLVGMSESMRRNERANTWLTSDCPAEVSIVWDDPDTGLRCKARIDKLNLANKLAIDLKTTRDCMKFDRALHDYGYARQAAMYCEGLRQLTGGNFLFCVVAVEKEPPYAVKAAPIGHPSFVSGLIEFKNALKTIAACRQSGEWPGYENPTEFDMPEYLRQPIQLIIDGTETVLA